MRISQKDLTYVEGFLEEVTLELGNEVGVTSSDLNFISVPLGCCIIEGYQRD